MTESKLISVFEVTDNLPEVNEEIPIRMFLSGYTLTPTYKELYNVYSVRYFFKVVIIDEDEKSYSKLQEIYLWRKR